MSAEPNSLAREIINAARAICVSQGGEPYFMMSAAVIGLPDYPQWTEYGGEATAAYDAALPLIVGPMPDVEIVAAKVHEAWMASKREQGVTSRPSEWGEEQMVTVLAVYAALDALPCGEPDEKCCTCANPHPADTSHSMTCDLWPRPKPEPTVDREALVWECGPHANAWRGHDARCRQVRTHGTDA